VSGGRGVERAPEDRKVTGERLGQTQSRTIQSSIKGCDNNQGPNLEFQWLDMRINHGIHQLFSIFIKQDPLEVLKNRTQWLSSA
jgi:hypothetical protein